MKRTENPIPGGAGFNAELASSDDLTEVTCRRGWSLVVLDATFMQPQGQLDTVLQGWRLVHKQPMPSGSHKVCSVRPTDWPVLFNGALWGWA